MRINGHWRVCDDDEVRPVLEGELRRADGKMIQAYFVVDTGADQTVICWDVWRRLGSPTSASTSQLAGVGGEVTSVAVHTTLTMRNHQGAEVALNGAFAALTQPNSLDISLLGRDILNHFAVLVDRQGDAVCLLRQEHVYEIREQ